MWVRERHRACWWLDGNKNKQINGYDARRWSFRFSRRENETQLLDTKKIKSNKNGLGHGFVFGAQRLNNDGIFKLNEKIQRKQNRRNQRTKCKRNHTTSNWTQQKLVCLQKVKLKKHQHNAVIFCSVNLFFCLLIWFVFVCVFLLLRLRDVVLPKLQYCRVIRRLCDIGAGCGRLIDMSSP